jgi:hypothetical protein
LEGALEGVTVHCDGQRMAYKVSHPDNRSISGDDDLVRRLYEVSGVMTISRRDCMGLDVFLRPGSAEGVADVLSCLQDQGYSYTEFRPS